MRCTLLPLLCLGHHFASLEWTWRVRLHRRLVDEPSDRSQAEVCGSSVYDLGAHKMQRRVYGIATAFSAVTGVGISHSFAAVDTKEVNSCTTAVATSNKTVLNDTAAILPPVDANKQMHITPESAALQLPRSSYGMHFQTM